MSRATPVLLAALLAACGQKGDLYLPAEEREVVLSIPTGVPAAPAPPAAPAGSADDDTQGTPRPDAGNTGR